MQFNGYDAGDVLVGTSGILSLDRDSANPAWQFLAAGFSGVRRLEIVSTNDRFSGEGWWAIDDLEIRDSQAAAPEPLTALLFGVGLAGIGWRARATKTRT